MKTYVETLTCPTSACKAWEALKEMNLWLPTLSTNRAVNYDRSSDFFYQGRTYEVVTREGVTMDSEIYLVDEAEKKVEIHASHSILKSLLTCSVERIDDHRCKLTRTQAYPGCSGSSLRPSLTIGSQGRRASTWRSGHIMPRCSRGRT